MKRGFFLGILLAIGTLSLSVAAYQQQQQTPKVVEVEKLKDNLFMLKGGGGNTAVFVMSNGVTVVDTKNPGWGQPILDKIKELTPKPVTTIINTHTHGDHVSGNVEFPATVEVITQENTAANMKKMAPVGTGGPANASATPPPNIFQQNGGKGLPKRTFKDRMTLGSGADRIELYYFGRGHTNGDAWILFPALRVVHAGDIFSGKNLPLLDANNGGSGVDIGDSLAKAASSLKDVDSIITGHSTVMTMADLREYAQFNKDFVADMKQAKAAGKSVDDVAKSWKMPAKYTGYAAVQEQRLRANVQVVYNELK
ncbi:MAG TPA: MBL fold metallo-hydrolase [Vicinamibacterales bacterium]|jgi:glyoxylase-like metal-dependent hydrolase (beta-lactamase superfamily II)